MQSADSQVSRTRCLNATFVDLTWDFSYNFIPRGGEKPLLNDEGSSHNARQQHRAHTHFARPQRSSMPRWRFADRLAHAAAQPFSGMTTVQDAVVSEVSLNDAQSLAFGLRTMKNAATAALRASTARGQLTCWRNAMPELPTDYLDGVDHLEVYQDQLIQELQDTRTAVAPHITRLNDNQPSSKCWSRPVPQGAKRGTWTGREPWVTHALNYLTTAMTGPSMAITDTNLRSLLHATAALASATGRGLIASHRTIAKLAITDFGCTLALSTATQRVRTARRLLEHAGFHRTHARGGHLNSLERLAAQAHHGGHQTRCGSTCDLILPIELRPTPPRKEFTPDLGLADRLAERDTRYLKNRKKKVANSIKSTYVCDSGFHSPQGLKRVSHTSASAREKNNSWKNQKITTRSWKVAEALTRQGATGAERGPYAHLVGDQPGQISLKAVALLIERYTPAWADVRAVMQGLAHAATGTTGYVALGLRTQPRSAWGWLSTVLGSIAWDQQDAWPTWSVTARAFGVDWRGARHRWGKTQVTAQLTAVASVPIRVRAMKKIREILKEAKA